MKRTEQEALWFVRSLAEGDSLLDEVSLSSLSAQLALPFGETRYFCMVVKYTDAGLEDPHLPTALQKACVQAAKHFSDRIYTYIGARFYVVMVVPERSDRVAAANRLVQLVCKHAQSPVQIGVGRSYQQLGKLSYSRVEAYEALGNMGPGEQIAYIDDIYVTRSITTRKLESEKQRILDMFKTGRLEQMMHCMEQLAEHVRAESPVREGAPYPTSIRRTVAELLFRIMHISADAGVDVDALLDHQDPYSRIFQLWGTPAILAWFQEVTKALAAGIAERSSKSENNMLVLAKRCVEEHLSDPELSLSLVSETLGITSAYFSALFIRETGVGFNEYVTGLRVEQAKQLLRETNLKINQIASRCGFRSASYFIVVFRKQTGLSPSEYRNRK